MTADLRALRKRLGLTQAELASILETTRQTICEQERGKTSISRERLLAVCTLVHFQDGISDPLIREDIRRLLPSQYT